MAYDEKLAQPAGLAGPIDRIREHAAAKQKAEKTPGINCCNGGPRVPRIYVFGLVQVSDHARQQLDAGLPKRSCENTFALAALPLTESCALRAGRKVL